MAKKAWSIFGGWMSALAVLALALGALVFVRGDIQQLREQNRQSRNRALVRDLAAMLQADLIHQPLRAAAQLAQSEIMREVLSARADADGPRSEEHTSELQSRLHLVCRLLLEKKNKNITIHTTTEEA